MAVAAILLWLLIVLLPGLALARLLRVPGSLPALAAIAAPVSLGLVYLVGLLASRAGLPVATTCLTVLSVLLVAWFTVEVVHRLRATGRPAPGATTRAIRRAGSRLAGCTPPVVCSRALLGVAIGAGLLLWTSLHAPLTVPAGFDAMHHGYFVRQIVAHDTLNANVVLSSDPSLPDGTTSFYPLGANLVAALLNVATGVPVSVLLLASTAALAGAVLPLGTYVLTRRLAPGLPLVAGFAALAAVLPAGLFLIESTGRITAVLGLALVPAAVGAICFLGVRVDWRLVVLSVLTLVGVAGVHTSELPIVVGLAVACTMVGACLSRRWRPSLLWLAGFAGTCALATLVLIAVDPGIRHVSGQRSEAFGDTSSGAASFPAAIWQLLTLSSDPPEAKRPMMVWSALAVAGCLLSLHPRWWRLAGATVGYAVFAGLFVAWMTRRIGPFATLTDPWYRQDYRMMWQFYVLGAIPVGIAFECVASLVRVAIASVGSRWRRARVRAGEAARDGEPAPAAGAGRPDGSPGPGLRWASAVVAVAAVVACAIVFTRPPVPVFSRWLSANYGPVGRDSQDAFRYLAAHVTPGERVLDDLEARGELWMYADHGVPTLFGNPPLLGRAPDSWKERLYLRGELRHIATDPCVADLLTKYSVTYVYYSGRKIVTGRPDIRLALLEDRRYFREVFREGDAYVYKISPPVAARPCERSLTAGFPWTAARTSK
jgi:hypothetical protein